MNEIRDFSKRYGFQKPPIEVIREEAPVSLRTFVLRKLSEQASGGGIHDVRRLVSNTLRYIPSPASQSVEEIWNEVVRAVNSCDWFLIYDLVEEIYRDLSWISNHQNAFLEEVNRLFEDQNIGWRLQPVITGDFGLIAPKIVFRGNEAFEMTIGQTEDALTLSGRDVASNEFKEAIQDLSRRPQPDLTGAVHHAIASLESVAAEVCGESGETLGRIAKHSDRFPAPLGDAVNKLYGFASDRGRHVTSGKTPSQKEAELVVSIAAAITTFLLR
jgi:hypothetical protein